MTIQPYLQTDFYKQPHFNMYERGVTKVYSNVTPRKSRMKGVNSIMVFGFQYFIKEYLIEQWQRNFFDKPWESIRKKYTRMINKTLGEDSITFDHIKQLHDLGYLPLIIKTLPEGSMCPIGVPCCTITNTVDHAYWLVNFLETIISCSTWQSMTSATIALEYKKIFTHYAMKTVGNADFVPWQGHDFSMRGMSSLESVCLSGAGHLATGFNGTDTFPAIEFLEQYYNADVDKELVGKSVPATEHSIIMLSSKDGEIDTFTRLLDLYPEGILSMVSDTWSLPKVVTEYLPILKNKILERKGKLVIRPDSFWTNPADCMCGYDKHHPQMDKMNEAEKEMIRKGLIESLWDIFGGTVNEFGYKVLDEHIGSIYGDSISLDIAEEICARMEAKGFASTNFVLGIGSFTYQFNTRDTFGFAIKATYGEVNGEGRNLFKDPITDDGMKRSAKGLLQVKKIDGKYTLKDQVTWAEEADSELVTVFQDGKLVKDWTLAEIRERANQG